MRQLVWWGKNLVKINLKQKKKALKCEIVHSSSISEWAISLVKSYFSAQTIFARHIANPNLP